jgi:hypothetical protein
MCRLGVLHSGSILFVLTLFSCQKCVLGHLMHAHAHDEHQHIQQSHLSQLAARLTGHSSSSSSSTRRVHVHSAMQLGVLLACAQDLHCAIIPGWGVLVLLQALQVLIISTCPCRVPADADAGHAVHVRRSQDTKTVTGALKCDSLHTETAVTACITSPLSCCPAPLSPADAGHRQQRCCLLRHL